MPSSPELEKALVDAAHAVFRKDRDNLTVNYVRKHVEAEFGLDDGFFKSEDWKGKSKDIIMTTAVSTRCMRIWAG
jgi:hypothetical protein